MSQVSPHLIRDLAYRAPLIAGETMCAEVHGLFREAPELTSVVVRASDDGLRLVTRREFVQTLSGGYGWALHHLKPVGALLTATPLLELVDTTHLASATDLVLDRPAVQRYDDVLVVGATGEYVGVLSIARLLETLGTAYRRQVDDTEARLQREHAAVERLAELDRTKNLVLAAVSHELRTPLTLVQGVAQTLSARWRDLPTAQIEHLLERQHAQAQRLDRMLVQLLALGQVHQAQAELDRRPTDLSQIAERCLEAIDTLTVEIVVVASAATPSIDPIKTEAIVDNLLRNAVRHTPTGTTVWLRSHTQGQETLIVVEDAGPGVPLDERDHIFEPFRHGRAAAHNPGAGIGLALVARFAELHDGRAWVEERAGGGASFRVLLRHPEVATPVGPADADATSVDHVA